MTLGTLLNPATRNPGFRTFDIQHMAVLLIIAVLCILLAWGIKRLPAPRIKWVGRLIGCLIIGYCVAFLTLEWMNHSLTWEYSLPLDLCNLTLVACILSMFRTNSTIDEITYFWGLGGALQALATPDLASGFPSWDFILFFWSHGAIMLGIVFIITGKNFRPRRHSVARMIIILNCYAVVVGTMNAVMGWNYGYLCRKPAMPSLFDFLGPWPWYILSLEGIALASFMILSLPWRIRKRPAP